jgi:undecaprenyl-diphosphatase
MALLSVDHALQVWVVGHRSSFLTPVMSVLSSIGEGGFVWFAIGLALLVARRLSPRGLLQLTLAILLAALTANETLKPLFGRERPFLATPAMAVIGPRPADASFPSGHSANAAAGATVLSALVPEGRLVWIGLAAAIAYSRIYLGVHYPLDAIVGALVGIACALLAFKLTRRILIA